MCHFDLFETLISLPEKARFSCSVFFFAEKQIENSRIAAEVQFVIKKTVL